MTEDQIREFVAKRIDELQTSKRAVSLKIGKDHAYIQQYITRKVPGRLPEDIRPALATVLHCAEQDLVPDDVRNLSKNGPKSTLSTEKLRPDGVLMPVELPTRGTLPKDVPVYGVTVGGQGGDFTFNGQTVDYVRRPPGLVSVPSAFALYVANDSMSPWKEPGDLVYVQPGRPAKLGDYVVVELKPSREGEAGVCLVKRLRARTASKLTLEQFNPKNDRLTIDTAKVKRVYRVIPLEELMGS